MVTRSPREVAIFGGHRLVNKAGMADGGAGFLQDIPNGEVDTFDNPDGVVRSMGLGAYNPAPGLGRELSQGAANPKQFGANSGHGQVMRVKDGSR